MRGKRRPLGAQIILSLLLVSTVVPVHTFHRCRPFHLIRWGKATIQAQKYEDHNHQLDEDDIWFADSLDESAAELVVLDGDPRTLLLGEETSLDWDSKATDDLVNVYKRMRETGQATEWDELVEIAERRSNRQRPTTLSSFCGRASDHDIFDAFGRLGGGSSSSSRIANESDEDYTQYVSEGGSDEELLDGEPASFYDGTMCEAPADHNIFRSVERIRANSLKLFSCSSSSSSSSGIDGGSSGKDEMDRLPAVGIDLGTTNSAVGLWMDGRPTLVPNSQDAVLTPSIVAFLNPRHEEAQQAWEKEEEHVEEEVPLNPFRPWQAEFYEWQHQHGGITDFTPANDDADDEEGVASDDNDARERVAADPDPNERFYDVGRIALRDNVATGGGCVVLVGEEARRQQARNPANTYCRVKRLLGRGGTTAAERTGVGPGVRVLSTETPTTSAADVAAPTGAGDVMSGGFEQTLVRGAGSETLLSAPYLSSPKSDAGRLGPQLRRTGAGAAVLSPVDVSAEVVRALLDDVSVLWQGPAPTRAVVGVPAHFDVFQREATVTACLLAGLQEVQLITEPEAAALAFGLGRRRRGRSAVALAAVEDERLRREQRGGGSGARSADSMQITERTLCVDLGGGTLDVSIVDVKADSVDTVATGGDARLGGDDFDAAVARWLEDQFVARHGRSLMSGGDASAPSAAAEAASAARWRLLDAAEEARVALSAETEVHIVLPDLLVVPRGQVREKQDRRERKTREGASGVEPSMVGLGLEVTLSRRRFEALCHPLILRTRDAIIDTATRAGVSLPLKYSKSKGATPPPSDSEEGIAHVVLCGGGARMHCMGRLLKELTGIVPRKTVNPDEVIAYGCTIQAAMLDGLIGDLRLVRAPPRKKVGADAAAAYRAKRTENATSFK